MENERIPLDEFNELEIKNYVKPKISNKNKKIIEQGFVLLIAIAVIAIASLLVFDGLFPGNITKNSNESNRGDYATLPTRDLTSKSQETETTDKTTTTTEEEEVIETQTISYAELSTGIRVLVSKGTSADFETDSTTHEIFVDNIQGDEVELTITSSPTFATLSAGESKKIDLDSDNVYDIEIYLLEASDDEALLELKKIEEEYETDIPDSIQEEVNDGFGLITTQEVPYSCLEKDKSLDYSYLRIYKDGSGDIVGDEKFTITKNDICIASGNGYRKYSCEEDNSYSSENIYCNTRYEDCMDGECVVGRYEKNIAKSNIPDEEASGENECFISIDNTIFWAKTTKKQCEDIYISSKVSDRYGFSDLLSFFGLYSTKIIEKTKYPINLEISYRTASEDYYFEDIENKLNSNSCETINFQGINLYCFNYIENKKENNLQNIIALIIYIENSSKTYSSQLISDSTFNFILNKDLTLSDSTNPDDQKTCPDSYSEYTNNKLYICENVFEYSSLYKKPEITASIYKGYIDAIGNTNSACYESIEYYDCIQELECQECNSYKFVRPPGAKGDCEDSEDDNRETTERCLKDDKISDCDYCDDWDKYIRYIPSTCSTYYYYINQASPEGEYINYLYAMSQNEKISCEDRNMFYIIANQQITQCQSGLEPSYIAPSYPSC